MSTIDQLLEEANEMSDWAAGLNDRTISWQLWNDELTCDEKQEVAADEAAEAARQAWDRLEAAERDERAAYRAAIAEMETYWKAVLVAKSGEGSVAA